MGSRRGPSNSSSSSASRLGAATPDSSSSNTRLDPSSASASTSQSHNRRTSLDTRSLRASSIRHPHLTASPSTAGAATSALSASPEELTIGRGLPSGSGGGRGGNGQGGGGGGGGGGAAATLKRVASNASIAASIRGVFSSSSAVPAEGKQQQQQQQPAPASGEQGQGAVTPSSSAGQSQDAAGKTEASKAAGISKGKGKDTAPKAQPSTTAAVPPPASSTDAQPSASSSSSSTPQASQPPPSHGDLEQQSSSSGSTTPSNATAAAGSKRQSPPSNHLRAEAASRGTAKRRTWYGWTVDDDAAASAQAGSSSASTADGGGQDVEMADGEAEPAVAAPPKAPEPTPPPPAPVAPTSTEQSQAQSDAQAQDTLKPSNAARAPRTSWFGWGTSTQPPPPPDTGPATVDAEMNDGQKAGSAEREDEATIKAKGQSTSEAPEAASKQGEPSPAVVDNVPPPPSWVWRLFGSQASQVGDAAMALPPPASEPAAADAEPAKADEEMQVDSAPAAANDSTWSRWIPIPYWGSTPAQQQEQTAASSSSSPAQAAPLTPAEQVKADALARPALQSPPIEAKDAILNAATRQSWISYFSNRNAAKPAAKVESGEPEVMEVDFGDQDAAARTKTTTQPPAAKPAAVASLAGPSSAKSSRPSTPRPDNAPKPDPAPPVDRPTTPLTSSKTKAVEAVKKGNNQKKPASLRPPIPNLVLPTFEDTFYSTPRSLQPPAGMLKRTLSAVNTWLSGTPPDAARLRTAPKLGKDGRSVVGQASSTSDELGLALAEEAAVRLPRAWSTMGNRSKAEKKGCQGMGRIVVIGIHGWFAQSWASRFMGEPTGTSVKFATEMRDAVLRHFGSVPGLELNMEAVTMIPLSADGTVAVRVDRSFAALLSKREWVEALDTADAVLFACHSQGCIVGTNLLARCIEQGVIHPRRSRISLLAMCGIHAGPFEHLRSTVVGSYLNYFENAAARELFEFQKSTSQQYRQYEHSLSLVLAQGVKVTLVASTDDQVVPLHSALFASAHHPSILRALYIHGPTFPRLDFLTNMLTFCVAVRNAGLADHDLLQLLSASVAGSLYGGLGHSLCYEEKGVYDLAVRYLFETTHPLCEPTTRGGEEGPPKLRVVGGSGPGTSVEGTSNGFASSASNNPHLLPWSLRGILEDRAVRATFGASIDDLVDSYEKWTPSTRTLRDVQYRLEPMRFVPRSRPRASASDDASAGIGASGGGGGGREGKQQDGKGAKASKKGKVDDERSGTEGSGTEGSGEEAGGSSSHDSTTGGGAAGKEKRKGAKEAAAPAKGKAVTTGKAGATPSTSSSKL